MLNLLPEQYNQFFSDWLLLPSLYHLLSNSSGWPQCPCSLVLLSLRLIQPLFAVTLTSSSPCVWGILFFVAHLCGASSSLPFYACPHSVWSLHEAGSEVSYWLFSSYAKLFLWVTAHLWLQLSTYKFPIETQSYCFKLRLPHWTPDPVLQVQYFQTKLFFAPNLYSPLCIFLFLH